MTFEPEQPPRRRRSTLIVAVVFVVVIAVAGIGIGVVIGLRGNRPTGGPAPASSKPSASAPGGRTAQGACGPVPYETTNQLTAAPATTWVAWSATTLATSSTAGPRKNINGVRTCYSRTPAGALFAAYNAAQYCSDTTVYYAAMSNVVEPGPGRDAAMAIAKTDPACEPSGQYVQGYKITSYDGSAATLYLELNAPSGLGEYGVQLLWKDGDWKLVLDANGNPTIATNQLTSSVGFTPWGPTNG